MKIEIAKYERMSERGSSILRLIQNNEMPVLDLLVRESVQNSLDAAVKGPGFVEVSFKTGDFRTKQLAPHFERIEDSLTRKYPKEKYRFLEIRDRNTTGLTGPLHYDDVKGDDFGNLLKLVYEISMPQQQEGSGGSWGLGKTVYFRIGIGLVIYYSRVKEGRGKKFSSRLAACLVENERKANSIIPEILGKPKRGIAWWGQSAGNDSTKPLTDEKEIRKILKVFNIEPYDGEETGTSIIIPFVDEKKLIESVKTADSLEHAASLNIEPWWYNSVQEYLKVSLQRWYAPRLGNHSFKNGRWLRALVDGKGIKAEDMLPMFRVVQALYNRTPLSKGVPEEGDILSDVECFNKDISVNKEFRSSSCAGYLSYAKLNSKQMLMTPPKNNPSPYAQVYNNDIEGENNPPIVMFTRKPGMIVGYETAGKWTDGISKTSDDEYIIGIFVANSANILKSAENEITLEEYIRKSEKADHTSWTDWNVGSNRMTLISKIQRHVSKNIGDTFSEKARDTSPTRKTGLGRVLAEMLLPPENFGNRATFTGKTGMGGGFESAGHSSVNAGLKILGNPIYENGQVKIDFELHCGKTADNLLLQLQVVSESGGIEAEKWESDSGIGKPFPVRLESFEIHQVKSGRSVVLSKASKIRLDDRTNVAEANDIKLAKFATCKFRIPYGVKISLSEKKGYKILGRACFSTKGEMIQGSLNVVQNEGDIA